MRFILLFFLVFYSILLIAQDPYFEFGKVTYPELQMTSYPGDTTTEAVVLREYGEAFFSNDHETSNFGQVIFEYHVKIKILKSSGLDKANFKIGLRKSDDGRVEKWESLAASTFNLMNNQIVETKLDNSNGFFIEKAAKYLDIVKFTLPEVRVGSVIEVRYRYASPFNFNFHRWVFQDDIPKMKNEFWARIPGNYIYNISLKGFLKLSRNESTIDEGCFNTSSSNKADCAFYKYEMRDIPAFRNEDYVSAKVNYISSINYELSEVKSFDGTIKWYTQTWEDVSKTLLNHEDFGKQIKKARIINDPHLKAILAGETDQLKKAAIIYKHICDRFSWNEHNSCYTELDTKRAYEARKGNVADINLTLVGVLQTYDINANPVIMSTRKNGHVTELYPVLSEFNYVVANVKIGDKNYILDATDPFLPFGLLSERTINGKGRLICKESTDEWIDLKPIERNKRIVTLDLKLSEEGTLSGKLQIQSTGYSAVTTRKKIAQKGDVKEYVKDIEKIWEATIENYIVENRDDLLNPLIETMQVTFSESPDNNPSTIYFNPFMSGRYAKNPFNATERIYPVDWGTPDEQWIIVSLKLPETIMVDEQPSNVGIQLPYNGGKFLVNATTLGNTITMTSIISINKPVYTAGEYHGLREFFARVVQAQQSQFVFKRKF